MEKLLSKISQIRLLLRNLLEQAALPKYGLNISYINPKEIEECIKNLKSVKASGSGVSKSQLKKMAHL